MCAKTSPTHDSCCPNIFFLKCGKFHEPKHKKDISQPFQVWERTLVVNPCMSNGFSISRREGNCMISKKKWKISCATPAEKKSAGIKI